MKQDKIIKWMMLIEEINWYIQSKEKVYKEVYIYNNMGCAG